MSIGQLKKRMSERGITVTVGDDGSLLVGPPSRLTDELRSAIRQHREAMLGEARLAMIEGRKYP